MSADVLREAAAEMHRDAQAFCDADNTFYHAVAGWLDAEASIQGMYPDRDDDDIANALAVATAYLNTTTP
jgi:hypothetical protein